MAFEGKTKAEVASETRAKGRENLEDTRRGFVQGSVTGLATWALLEALGFEIFRLNPAAIAGGFSFAMSRKGNALRKGRKLGFAAGTLLPEATDLTVEFLKDSEIVGRIGEGLGGLTGAGTTAPQPGIGNGDPSGNATREEVGGRGITGETAPAPSVGAGTPPLTGPGAGGGTSPSPEDV